MTKDKNEPLETYIKFKCSCGFACNTGNAVVLHYTGEKPCLAHGKYKASIIKSIIIPIITNHKYDYNLSSKKKL